MTFNIFIDQGVALKPYKGMRLAHQGFYYIQYRYMQEFLGASKAFFTEKWAYIYRNYGREDFFVMYIVGKFILSLPFTYLFPYF